jgi:hypothetical protein
MRECLPSRMREGPGVGPSQQQEVSMPKYRDPDALPCFRADQQAA